MKLLMENWRNFLKEDYDRQKTEERKIGAVGDDEYLTDRNLTSLLDGAYKIVGPLKGIEDKHFDDDPDKEYEYYIVKDAYNDPVFRESTRSNYVAAYEFRDSRYKTGKEAAEEAVRVTVMRYKERQDSDLKNLESLTPAQMEQLSTTLEGYEKFINSIPMRTLLKAFGVTPNLVKKQVVSFAQRDALGELKINDGSADFKDLDTLGLSPAQIPMAAAMASIFIVMAGFDISEQEKLRGIDAKEFYWSKVVYFWAPKAGFLSPVTLLKSAVDFVRAWKEGDSERAMKRLAKILGIEAVEAFEQIQAAEEDEPEPTGQPEEAPANRDEDKSSGDEKLLAALKALEKLEDKEGS